MARNVNNKKLVGELEEISETLSLRTSQFSQSEYRRTTKPTHAYPKSAVQKREQNLEEITDMSTKTDEMTNKLKLKKNDRSFNQRIEKEGSQVSNSLKKKQ